MFEARTAAATAGWVVWCSVAAASALASGCDRGGSPAGSPEASGSAAGTVQSAISTDQSMSGTTERGRYYLEVTPDPNPVPFQEFVTIRVRVHAADDRDSPLEGAELNQFRARMPAHDHGLKTDPTVERIGPGEFVLKGVRFHMRGRGEDGHWTLEFVVDGPRGLDTATFDLQCCRLTDD